MSLKLDGPISGPLLPLPSPFRRDNAHTLFVSGIQNPSGLPPFVVAGIGHVQNVTVVESQAARRKAVVFQRIVVEQRPVQQTRKRSRNAYFQIFFLENDKIVLKTNRHYII